MQESALMLHNVDLNDMLQVQDGNHFSVEDNLNMR